MLPLLDDITSGDAQRIWSGAIAIARLRDPAQLDELSRQLPAIKGATEGVALGGAVFPNKGHLKFAIAKLEFWAANAGCLCALYPSYLFFNPEQEQEAGHVRILSSTIDRDAWSIAYSCGCALCGTHFDVERGEYHYSWWRWSVRARTG